MDKRRKRTNIALGLAPKIDVSIAAIGNTVIMARGESRYASLGGTTSLRSLSTLADVQQEKVWIVGITTAITSLEMFDGQPDRSK